MQKLRYRIGDTLRTLAEFCEDQWFDRTRHVRTSGNVSLRAAGIAPDETRDSELYVPARPANIRQALREIPVQNVSDYVYIDLGSGKGRSLLVAAEKPFQQITGVEFSALLHRQACENIRRFRFRKHGSKQIDSLHLNAKDFVFPDQKTVLYLFNPFGYETVAHVLGNLKESLLRSPRHVVVVLLWPRCGDQVMEIPGMRLVKATRRHEMFEVNAPGVERAS